eukprot:symbB.v1.2.016082.t2/scaffold1216.1/size131131/8
MEMTAVTGERTWEPWFQHESRTTPGRFYYINVVTGDSVWEPPTRRWKEMVQVSRWPSELPGPPPPPPPPPPEEPVFAPPEHVQDHDEPDPPAPAAADYRDNAFTDDELPRRKLSTASALSCTHGTRGVRKISVAVDAWDQSVESGVPSPSSEARQTCGQELTWIRGPLIGRGSLGRVFKAVELEDGHLTGRIIAVKEVCSFKPLKCLLFLVLAHIVMARPVLLPVLGVVAAVYTASLAFVGTPQAAPRVSRVPARVSAEYLERLGPKDSDVPFDPSAATGPGASVEFKKRPFGILRYQPGQSLKGAMAMEIIPKSRYPGDPQGQAFASGVQSGWVVTSINGQNVQNEDFGKIMDLLDDEVADPRFSKSTALALEKQGGRLAEPAAAPLAVQFNSIPGYVYKGAELKEDGQDGFAR